MFEVRLLPDTGMGYVIPHGWGEDSQPSSPVGPSEPRVVAQPSSSKPEEGRRADEHLEDFTFSSFVDDIAEQYKKDGSGDGIKTMSSADELFHNGKIRPLQSIPHHLESLLNRSSSLSTAAKDVIQHGEPDNKEWQKQASSSSSSPSKSSISKSQGSTINEGSIQMAFSNTCVHVEEVIQELGGDNNYEYYENWGHGFLSSDYFIKACPASAPHFSPAVGQGQGPYRRSQSLFQSKTGFGSKNDGKSKSLVGWVDRDGLLMSIASMKYLTTANVIPDGKSEQNLEPNSTTFLRALFKKYVRKKGRIINRLQNFGVWKKKQPSGQMLDDDGMGFVRAKGHHCPTSPSIDAHSSKDGIVSQRTNADGSQAHRNSLHSLFQLESSSPIFSSNPMDHPTQVAMHHDQGSSLGKETHKRLLERRRELVPLPLKSSSNNMVQVMYTSNAQIQKHDLHQKLSLRTTMYSKENMLPSPPLVDESSMNVTTMTQNRPSSMSHQLHHKQHLHHHHYHIDAYSRGSNLPFRAYCHHASTMHAKKHRERSTILPYYSHLAILGCLRSPSRN